jgi:hypothetical protein
MNAPDAYAIRDGQTLRNWADSIQRSERLFSGQPKIGLVVGTFAAVPYIHLHLETRRRLYPQIPMLVHDDCSPQELELANLCAEYGTEFISTANRFPICKGDLSAIASGLIWARAQRLDILVKMSRRFLPLKPWADELAALAITSQYATYSSWTTSFNFGFRTECVGLAVEEWFALGLFDQIVETILHSDTPFVEGFIHRLARHASVRNSKSARAFDAAVGQRPRDRDGYAPWPFMGTDRCAQTDNFLWHDWSKPEDYAAQAQRLGLAYDADAFRDPNMGSGSRPSAKSSVPCAGD